MDVPLGNAQKSMPTNITVMRVADVPLKGGTTKEMEKMGNSPVGNPPKTSKAADTLDRVGCKAQFKNLFIATKIYSTVRCI